MEKSVLYLDQNLVSKMAKAKLLSNATLTKFGTLYNRLAALVDHDRVICPESLFHELETNISLSGANHEVVTRLSYGLRFRRPWEILRVQAFEGVRTYMGLEPECEAVFSSDPHESIDNRIIRLGSVTGIPTRVWQVDPSQVKPTLYLLDRETERGKFTWNDLPARIHHQKDGVIRWLYGCRVDEPTIGLAADLRDYWAFVGGPEASLAKFLESDALRNSPFIDIHCTLCAAMGCEPRRRARPGDALDTLIMATVIPYCDVVVTSSDMAALMNQTRLANKYSARIYSEREVDNLSDWLANF